jgi:hypothetical protein
MLPAASAVIPSGGVAPAGSVAKVVAGLRIHATAESGIRVNATNAEKSATRKHFIDASMQ